ncbi:unnamed protein product [Caenorhabditis nigoni]
MCAILFKTPEIMKKLKWYLLCLHISTVLFDCSISILTIPVILFPEFAGYPLGLFKWVDTKYYVYPVVLAIMFMGGVLVSIIAIFENQYFTICSFSAPTHWLPFRKAWLIFHIVLTILSSISFGCFVPDQSIARQNVFRKLPHLPEYFYEIPIFVFTENGSYHLIMFLILVPFCCLETTVFVSGIVRTTSRLFRTCKMSRKSYKLQNRFFIALLIQTTLPLITLVIPFVYSWISILWRLYDQGLMNIAVIFTTIHGLSSTIMMFMVHQPYREFLMSIFCNERVLEKRGLSRKNVIIVALHGYAIMSYVVVNKVHNLVVQLTAWHS